MIIGIYGGSFNPIHVGHIAMARALVSREVVDQVWFMVSPHNPLKESDGLWPEELRLELARRAVADIPGLEVSDFEMHLPRPSYMFTTLQELSREYPQHQFVLIIGTDNWECFDRWYRHQDILQNHRIVILPRQTGNGLLRVIDHGTETILPDPIPEVNISSTWIRQQLAENPDYKGEGLPPGTVDIVTSTSYKSKTLIL